MNLSRSMNLSATINSDWIPSDEQDLKDLLETLTDEEDVFAAMFDTSWLNLIHQGFYYSGLISCFGLLLISWFEKSGQAGPFRTLINQLVSMRLDQLVLFYILATGPNNVRHLTGPLPWYICRAQTFFAHWWSINACHLTVVIAAAKFAFLYIFKSMPVMNDDLISLVIWIVIHVWGFLAASTFLYLSETIPLAEKVCLGTWTESIKQHPIKVPIMPIVTGYTFLLYVSLTMAVKFKGEKKPIQHKYNNAGQVMDLSSLITNTITTLCMIGSMWSYKTLNHLVTGPTAFSDDQTVQAIRGIVNPCLFVMTTVQALHHFLTNRHLRRAAWRIFFS